MPGGRIVVVEHAWDWLDEPTARWYFRQRRTTNTPTAQRARFRPASRNGGQTTLTYTATRRCAESSTSASPSATLPGRPHLYGELGEEFEQEERRRIEAGAIKATGFIYVGEWGSG